MGLFVNLTAFALLLFQTNLAKAEQFRFGDNGTYRPLQIQRANSAWEKVKRNRLNAINPALQRFLNLSHQDLKALSYTLPNSRNQDVSFGDIRRFLVKNERKFRFSTNGSGQSFLQIKRVVNGREWWEWAEKSKTIPLLERLQSGRFRSPAQRLTAEAMFEFIQKAGWKASLGAFLKKLKQEPFDQRVKQNMISLRTTPINVATKQDVENLGHLNTLIATNLDTNLNNQNSNCPPTIQKPRKNTQASGGVDVLWSGTKKQLFRTFEGKLNQVVRDQSASNNLILQNKAKIFALGLTETKKLLKSSGGADSEYANEELRILKAVNPSPLHVVSIGNRPLTQFREDWMDYSNQKSTYAPDNKVSHTFVNFANRTLGGGWKTQGNVQEEQMAQQSPEFAAILSYFNTGSSAKPLYTRKGGTNAEYANPGSADPILISQIGFTLPQDKTFAEKSNGALRQLGYDPRANGFRPLTRKPPAVNMLAMAAPRLAQNQKGQLYSANVVADLFTNAFEGFRLVKTHDDSLGKQTRITSGLWGAGAFGHNPQMSLAVQYAAARLAGIQEIEFTGIRGSNSKNRHGSFDTLFGEIDQKLTALQKQFSGRPIPTQKVVELLYSLSQQKQWKTS